MTQPIEITVLKLFREFNNPPAVAKFLGMKYSEVIHILTKEYENQREVKALVEKDISEWKSPYKSRTYVDRRKIKAEKVAKQTVEAPKSSPSITFGYGGNNLLNKDKPFKNNNYYLNERKALL